MSKPTRNTTRRRSNRRHGASSTGSVEFFTRPSQSLPILLLLFVWRWRWELIATTVLVVAYRHLADYGLETAAVIVIMTTVLAVLLVVPPTRRFVRTRMWCVIVRHRLRSCMNELRTLNYSGNLPFILTARGTKVGEAVWIWMRPGLSVTDLETRIEHLAAACFARDVRVHRSRKMAPLVRIDTVRRDPLAANTITSPLLGTTKDLPASPLTDGPVLPQASTGAVIRPIDEAKTSSESAKSQTRTATKKSKPTKAAVASDAQVVVLNGEDVSDYV